MSGAKFYAWRKGFPAKVEADAAGAEVERIREEKGGEVTRDDVKEAARPKGSVLHKQVFDCGQKSAAERYYSKRAGDLLSNLTVEYEVQPNVTAPAYVVTEQREDKGAPRGSVSVFKSTDEALSDDSHREYVLAQALAQFAALRRRYAALSELAPVFAALDEVANA